MTPNKIQFKIDQLRQDKIIMSVESIAVLVFCFFAIAFLPRILFTYYFANQQLLEEPAVLTHMPLFFFVVGVAYFVFAHVGNIMRKMKIRSLEKEMEQMMGMGGCCVDCSDCSCDDHGNCNCGCDDNGSAMSMTTSGSTSAMAEKMSSVNRKRKSSKRK